MYSQATYFMTGLKTLKTDLKPLLIVPNHSDFFLRFQDTCRNLKWLKVVNSFSKLTPIVNKIMSQTFAVISSP